MNPIIAALFCTYFFVHLMSDFVDFTNSKTMTEYTWKFVNFAISAIMLYLFIKIL